MSPPSDYNNPERRSTDQTIARIDERVEVLQDDVKAIWRRLDEVYVTQKEFWPVRVLVYGLVGVILLAVFTAVIGLVVNSGMRELRRPKVEASVITTKTEARE